MEESPVADIATKRLLPATDERSGERLRRYCRSLSSPQEAPRFSHFALAVVWRNNWQHVCQPIPTAEPLLVR